MLFRSGESDRVAVVEGVGGVLVAREDGDGDYGGTRRSPIVAHHLHLVVDVTQLGIRRPREANLCEDKARHDHSEGNGGIVIDVETRKVTRSPAL